MSYSAMTAKILKSIRMSVALGVALLLISQPLQAQQSAGAQKQAAAPLRTFSQGPLTWADFQAAAAPDRSSDCWLEYSYLFDTVTRRSHGARYLVNQLSCLVDPQLSFARPEVRTPQMLAYSQVLFNLAELQCRYLQPVLCQSGWDYASDSIVALAFKQNDYDVKLFHYESYYGTDSLAVFRWLDSTNRLLAEMPSAAQARVADAPGWGLGAHIGMGYSWPGKGIDATFKNAYSFQMGVELLNRRHSFMWDMIIGGGGSKRSFIFEDGGDTLYYPVGHRYTWFQMDFDYGYYVVHKDKFAMMPFVGFGFSSISATYGYGDEAPMYGDACFSWFAGVACDWIMRNRVSGLFFDGTREREETGLRVMLYAARSALCGYNTVSANLAVSLNFESRSAKLKY